MDSEPSVLVAKWHCAKNAFVTIMRSWTGVIQLTSDELGLTTLVCMLRDTKVRMELFQSDVEESKVIVKKRKIEDEQHVDDEEVDVENARGEEKEG